MKKILMAMAAVMLFAFNAEAAEKIGFVDFQKALNECKAGVEAKAKLEKEGEKLAGELDEKQKVLKKLNDEIEKKESVWSKKVLDKKIAEFKEKLEIFQKEASMQREELNRKKVASEQEIIGDLQDLVAGVAEKKGYTIILEKSAGGVMYSNAEHDITNVVIQQYDKEYRKKK